MKSWRKYCFFQLLICLLFGGIHIIIGMDTEDATEFMTGIYGLSLKGVDYIRALLWLLPLLSISTFCGMHIDMEVGSRKYFTLPRYGKKKIFWWTILKNTQIGAAAMGVLSGVTLGILGVFAASYNDKASFIFVSHVVLAVVLYSVHIMFLVMFQTIMQLLTENMKLSQLVIVAILILVCFLKDLPAWIVWLCPGAWGSINYSSVLRKGGFSPLFMLVLETALMGSVILYVRMGRKK